MSGEDQAQKYLSDGLKLAFNDKHEEAIPYYTKALDLGLPPKDEIVCRAYLGHAYGQVENIPEHIKQFEAAILLDSRENIGFFKEKIQRDFIFRTIQLSYVLESKQIREEKDIDAAISYLVDKLENISYIPGIQMPLIHLELGELHRENGQKDYAISSLKKAIEAEHTDEPDDFYYDTLNMAKNNLALLEEEQKKRGCFIATAAYGSPMADEVRILEKFRDQCMLSYSIGRYSISLYYFISPPLARFLSSYEPFKYVVKAIVFIPSVFLAKLYFSMKINKC